MRFYPLFIISIIILNQACHEKPDTEKYLFLIDSLEISLEESAVIYEMIDKPEIERQLTDIEETFNETVNKTETEKTDLILELVKNGFESYLNTRASVLTDLNYTRSQLNDLKFDIKKGLLNDKTAVLYFQQEKQSVNVLKLKLDYYTDLVKSNQENYFLLIQKLEETE